MAEAAILNNLNIIAIAHTLEWLKKLPFNTATFFMFTFFEKLQYNFRHFKTGKTKKIFGKRKV
jgi:hypothetical protein